MTDAERLIATTNFDNWHRELDIPEYDHTCEHRPWEKKAYVAGYERAKKEHEDVPSASEKAVRYMISVWDEVTGKTWREKPDHVQQKFLEAEKTLKAR